MAMATKRALRTGDGNIPELKSDKKVAPASRVRVSETKPGTLTIKCQRRIALSLTLHEDPLGKSTAIRSAIVFDEFPIFLATGVANNRDGGHEG